MKDFPDFDIHLAKNYLRQALTDKYGNKTGFRLYNMAIARYLPSGAQKTIVFQAALSWQEGNKTLQKRYDIHYTYLLTGSDETIAANCPNCGGALGYGETDCPYCGSRISNILGNTWKFTQFLES